MPHDAPTIVRGGQVDYKRLFDSDPNIALIRRITILAGYGELELGTVLAEVQSGNAQGYMVPYNPTTPDSGSDQPGRAFVVTNPVSTEKICYVTMDDSYKFSVGDEIIINDSSVAKEDLGAITAIDRTSERHRAKITFTNALSGSFTVANDAYIAQNAGGASNNYSDAVGILMTSVDTGTGENAAGATVYMVVSNAILYTGMIRLLDSAAKTDLNLSESGQYAIIK